MQLYSSHTVSDDRVRKDFESYFHITLRNNLWYQPETSYYFTLDCLRQHLGKFNSVFTYSQGQFLKEKRGTTEYVGKNLKLLNRFTDKKILLIGGGPSTDAIDWDANDYDYLVSCNNFYLNTKLANSKLGLVYINSTHDYPDIVKFVQYIKENKPVIITDSLLGVQKISPLLLQSGNFMEMELRFNGRIGILPRLIICLCIAGAKSIDIVGMDGVSPKSNVRYHSFLQKEVAGIGSAEEFYTNWNDVVWCYQRNYIMLFDYIFNELRTITSFNNLAEDCEDNILSGISKVWF